MKERLKEVERAIHADIERVLHGQFFVMPELDRLLKEEEDLMRVLSEQIERRAA